jgi:hypothetical protein
MLSPAASSTPLPQEVATLALATYVDAGLGGSESWVLCVAVEKSDPPSDVIRSLQRPNRMVVAGSECKVVLPRDPGTHYIKTHRPAAYVNVHLVGWQSSTALTVEASFQHNGKWGAGRQIDFIKIDGHWVIAKKGSEWVS